MLKYFLHRTIAQLERAFRYDATYLHDVTDVSTAASVKFMLFQFMSQHRDAVPIDAWCAAKMAATISEDCGPCTQLVVDAAIRSGMRPDRVAALLRGDLEQAGRDAEFGFRYGIAVAQNTPDAPALSEEAERRYGKRARVSLAFAVAASRVYPALKRGLGYGVACTKISVSNETIVLKQAA